MQSVVVCRQSIFIDGGIHGRVLQIDTHFRLRLSFGGSRTEFLCFTSVEANDANNTTEKLVADINDYIFMRRE